MWRQGSRLLTAGPLLVRLDPRFGLTEEGDLTINGFEPEDAGDYDCEFDTDTEPPVSIRHTLHVATPPSVSTVPTSGYITVVQVGVLSL